MHSVYAKKNCLSSMYTFMLSHNVKLPALKEHKEFLGFSLFG